MSDLISRQAAIDEWKNDFKGYINALNMPRDDYKGIMEYIDEFPSAQPEIKTGRWIKPTGMMPPEHHGHYECSECGAWAMRPWLRPWKGVVLTDFCPACGIQMRKEDDS